MASLPIEIDKALLTVSPRLRQSKNVHPEQNALKLGQQR